MLNKPWLLIVWLLVIVAAASQTSKLTFSNDHWLLDDDPQELSLDLLNSEFEKGESAVIILPLETEWFQNPNYFDQVKNLEEKLREIDSVDTTESPASARIAYEHRAEQDEFSTLEIGSFIDFFDASVITFSDYETEFRASPFMGRLLSDDTTTAAIKIRMDTYEKAALRQHTLELINDVMQQSPWSSNYMLVGDPVVKQAINASTRDDLPKLLAIAALVILLIMWLVIGNFVHASIASASAFSCTLLSLQTMIFQDFPMTAPGLILPILVCTVATADALHILHFHQHNRTKFDSPFAAIKNTIMATAIPCFMASLTTLLGVGTFLFSPLQILAEFSLVAIESILIAFPVLLICMSIFLYVFDKYFGAIKISNLIKIDMTHIYDWMLKHKKFILLSVPVSTLLLSAGLFNLQTESNFLRLFFQPESSIRAAFNIADEKLKGSNNIDIVLVADTDSFTTVQAMEDIIKFNREFQSLPAVLDVESYLTTLEHVHVKLIDDGSTLPEDDDAVSQELFFLDLSQSETEDSVLTQHLNFDKSTTRIRVRSANLPSTKLAILINDIQTVLDDHSKELENLAIQDLYITGFGSYLHTISTYILETQVWSLLLTLSAIALLLLAAFRFSHVMAVLIVNVLPLGAIAGLISWLNIPYDFGTILVVGACLGLSIDHCLHIMHHYHRRKNTMRDTLAICGVPIINACLVLLAGIIALYISSLPLVTRFSVLTSIGIILGVITSLLVLPLIFSKKTSQ